MMRCILCCKLSFSQICKKCQNSFLKPSLNTRIVGADFKVFSFYNYADIAPLLKTKHTHLGACVYKILADIALKEFAKNFSFEYPLYAIGIDDHSRGGYAHTAILTRALKTEYITPLYAVLRANNTLSYSGKDLAYRLSHPRDFVYKQKRELHHDNNAEIEVILVDDILTTGTTLLEAKKVLEEASLKPLFALTLADARES